MLENQILIIKYALLKFINSLPAIEDVVKQKSIFF